MPNQITPATKSKSLHPCIDSTHPHINQCLHPPSLSPKCPPPPPRVTPSTTTKKKKKKKTKFSPPKQETKNTAPSFPTPPPPILPPPLVAVSQAHSGKSSPSPQ